MLNLKPTGSFFEEITSASNKMVAATLYTLYGIATTGMLTILAVSLLHISSYLAVFICVIIQLIIAIAGAVVMSKANNERIQAIDRAIEDLRKELMTKYLPRSS